ncbi:MAG: hypothetical protein C4523_12120 [Myxococcales bacterium]|nr:MAG: hypothetical protein C4523_12120 [Myxococcales bacterium]
MRTILRHAPLFFLFASALVAIVACGDGRNGFTAPRILRVAAPADVVRGVVPVNFTLEDGSGWPLDLEVSFRLGAGDWRIATAAPGAGAGPGVVASGGAASTFFLWDTWRDVGLERVEAALRVTAANPDRRASAESEPFVIDNANGPPQVLFDDAIEFSGGLVGLRIALVDSDAEAVRLTVGYSTDDGETFHPAKTFGNADRLSASRDGDVHAISWDAGADLGWREYPNVRLRAVAKDGLGEGPASDSSRFAVVFEAASRLTLDPMPVTARGDVAIGFLLGGPAASYYDARVEYSLDGGETYAPCTAKPTARDPRRNLAARPEGAHYVFTWETERDLSAPTIRGLHVLVTLLAPGGGELKPPIWSFTTPFGLTNGPVVGQPLIGEVYMGLAGADDGFLELTARPGTPLDGYRLYEVWRDGFNGIPLGRAFVALDGFAVGPSGAFVVAGPEGPPADLVWERFDTFFAYGLPTNFVLDRTNPGTEPTLIDALGFGADDAASWSFQGEGRPAPAPEYGQSLTRDFADADTGDNYLDFIAVDPSPGQARRWLTHDD